MLILIGLYSCLLFKMCSAKDDWRFIVFYVSLHIPLLFCSCVFVSIFGFGSCCNVLLLLKAIVTKPKIDKIQKNTKKPKYISLLVTHTKCHILDKPNAAYIRDIKNVLLTYLLHGAESFFSS